jgi:hypothetical protein
MAFAFDKKAVPSARIEGGGDDVSPPIVPLGREVTLVSHGRVQLED